MKSLPAYFERVPNAPLQYKTLTVSMVVYEDDQSRKAVEATLAKELPANANVYKVDWSEVMGEGLYQCHIVYWVDDND